MQLSVVISIAEDGNVEARCDDLDISATGADIARALSHLWMEIGEFLSAAQLGEMQLNNDKALPYYGPDGGLH